MTGRKNPPRIVDNRAVIKVRNNSVAIGANVEFPTTPDSTTVTTTNRKNPPRMVDNRAVIKVRANTDPVGVTTHDPSVALNTPSVQTINALNNPNTESVSIPDPSS